MSAGFSVSCCNECCYFMLSDLALEVRRLRRLKSCLIKNELIFETSFKKYILNNGARSFSGNASFRGIYDIRKGNMTAGKL